VALLLSLLLFAGTSYLVLSSGAGFLDRPVLREAVEHRQAVLHEPMTYVTHAADFPLIIAALLLSLLLAWRDASWMPPVLVGSTAVLALAAATVAKELTDRARPPAKLWEIQESGVGYPSRHTLIATAVLFALAYVLAARSASRLARITLCAGAAVLSLLIGATRVYLGVHWPTDVVAGLALGAATSLLVITGYALWDTRRDPLV
jgi:undecaprenyl-diphosphatase